MSTVVSQSDLCEYYRWQSRIYDQTRWSFLFGRSDLLHASSWTSLPSTILEIGCGTGSNLWELARLNPQARLIGMDISPEMLGVARRKLDPLLGRVTLLQGYYDSPRKFSPAPDLIVISYCLSMVNPGWESVISAAVEDLSSGGCLAVVDFHGSPWPMFRRWMRCNHVSMEEHLLPALRSALPRHRSNVRVAFGGAWTYFRFLGFKDSIRERGR